MRVVILYRPRSEHARIVEEFIHDFIYQHPDQKLEVLDVDTRDGSNLATLYEVMSYPAILVIEQDGHLIKSWIGDFPLMNELAYYTNVTV